MYVVNDSDSVVFKVQVK